ncbi:MAG TPA: nuclease [Hungateiclostridium thermocellum]|uniref:Thoeris protein ThsB TIR-like domain-containing protein n=1 Tax=Acetivibrio thermocellus (strain ATCC 27405 / DSM 1237 / JCM 9322 / NBRC 103400 / NCIMB 10682 / NRRL B-4536 / VPI 7372) TaxID=203119 RepID=A3DI79_ACET2|nr:TIR domain-containing protein [Acetivibrio thermocellus]ABN53658.1 Domain of unknown function DUF1863 [Acetivibrio thermocellus ATCC 27405]HBW27864.1 nuclease [Acetivibrio thermocellus]
MPNLKIYDLFISHAWKYNDDYYRLVDLLNKAPNFKWRNYSVPQHDPVIDPDDPVDQKTLIEELKGQIRPVNCVLILSGMYAAYSFWIQKEIDISVDYGKPIIGIKPWGQERIPKAVSDVAIEIVGWNTDAIVEAIRKHSL